MMTHMNDLGEDGDLGATELDDVGA